MKRTKNPPPGKKRIKNASAKAKGRALQQWVCQKISNLLNLPWGKDELIASREASQSGTDVRLIGEARQRFPFSVECKAQETWALPGWIKQAQANQEPGSDWLLFCKRRREKPVVVMDAERFFELQRRAGNLTDTMMALLRGAQYHLKKHKCLKPSNERCEICYLLDEIEALFREEGE